MHSTLLISLLAVFTCTTVAVPIRMNARRDVDASLVPPFGITAGQNPDGTGNCDGTIGPTGKPILIPCACPPPEDVFLKSLNDNVNAGHAVNNPAVKVSFPTDNSPASQIARIQAVLVSLQNLHGPGVGCPAASTTLLALQKSIQSGAAQSPAPPPAAPAQSSSPSSSGVSNSDVAKLAPSLGFTSGKNPTGTGDCDGAVNGPNGQPIKVPCSCPPSQDEFLSQLEANVAAGHAVHNPDVSVSYPLDNSPASQRARIIASLITVQNLKGAGVGCPAASTTLSAQLAAIQG
jgi:hypothetical protein